MTGTTNFFISIKSYLRCCCMKRGNGDDDGNGNGNGASFDKNNIKPCIDRSPYTFDDLTLPESPIYNSTSNSNSSSNWSLSSSSESNECNADYRVFPMNNPSSPHMQHRDHNSVFHPFLST